MLTFICMLIFTVFIFMGENILLLLTKPQYVECYIFIIIMMTGIIPACIFFWIRPYLLVLGKAKQILYSIIISVIVQISILLTTINYLGLYGASISIALSYILNVILFYIYYKSSLKANRCPVY